MCFLPPMEFLLLLPSTLKNVDAMNMGFQKWYLEWPSKHQFCDCSVCTRCWGQWQGPGIKLRKRGESKRDGSVFWGRNGTYGTCEGDPLEFIKNYDIIYWGRIGLGSRKNVFNAWQEGQCTYSVTLTRVRLAIVTTLRQWVLHVLSMCL